MQLTILGNGSGGPFQGRHFTAQVLKVENETYLIDCGEGTQMQIHRFKVKTDACNQVFISHLHGDHVFGLLGMITNWSHKKRTETLHIYSPPGLQEMIETSLRVCGVYMNYPLEFHEVDPAVQGKVFESPRVEVWTVPLIHRCPASGWLFREKPRLRNILPEKIEEYQIPFAEIPDIKSGADFTLPDGRVIPNAELTHDPPEPASFAFCSDTVFSEKTAEYVKGVHLLYHEATFSNEREADAWEKFHSTAAQAASVAKLAGARKLLLGHFSGRYKDTETHLAEAREIFAATEIGEEGLTWVV